MRRRYLLWGYLALLLASYLWRALTPSPQIPDPERQRILLDVSETKASETDDRDLVDVDLGDVDLAYREWGRSDAPVIVLLHGSPGSASDFSDLAPRLADGFRLIAPDLPGFGRSSRTVPDYSIAAHARYVDLWLHSLGVERAHVVGFSMGGGVALELYDLAPERVASITLLSAIGVQEQELLGNYHLNHALHGLQLWGLRALHYGVPHFGALDASMLSVEYARNFYDTDQRPLRGILERLDVPLLILHGDRDPLVPLAAALEHERIVPQSELVRFDASHFMVFSRSGRLEAPLRGFVQRVEDGTAIRRSAATADRVERADGPPLPVPAARGFARVIWTTLLAFSTLLSEDLACIAGGLLVAQGRLGFIAASVACGAGIFFGDLLLYLAGRLGSGWLDRRPLSWIVSPAEVERSKAWFEERGSLVILLSRFIPGTRLPTYVAAGVLKLPFFWFAIRLLIPVALWTPLLVALAWFLGERFLDSFLTFSRYALPGFILFLLGMWILLGLTRSLASHRGRRLLYGWWRRKRDWEFWPPFVFYPPVVLYVLWLGIKYRSLTLFTASNPGIPESGFIGESKLDILDQIDPRWVASYRKLDGDVEKRTAQVRTWMEELGTDFPVVLKPDVGQRGLGVKVARDDAQVRAYLETAPEGVLVQKYVAGPEFGVFYVRLPGEECGRVFSVTEKILPIVIGDGHSTLEELILADDRAVAMAEAYFAVQRERLDGVPALSESVRLVDLGTHCRGAIFLDGSEWITPELETAIETISRSFDGFYFGRFDLRVPSVDALAAGRDIQVLELNGVTSEATHIYDPKNSLFDAYRVLFEQWRLAFEIGHRNRQQGHDPAGILDLARQVLAFRRDH